jgi:hypothetical protein
LETFKLIFDIIINFIQFFSKLKINMNDVTKDFFVVNFHHFANIKKAININKGYLSF